MGYDNNVYVQIGNIMLIGLAAKNAILIVEFAKAKQDAGSSVQDAAIEAARLRFRPILMTAFAFILGVVPLMLASGAGSGAQNVMGTAVFWGMLVATALGVFIIPGNFAFIQGLRFSGGSRPRPSSSSSGAAAPAGASVKRSALLPLALLLAGCTVGPDYQRPTVDAPPDFRGALSPPSPESLGDLRWWQVFPDETLQSLIRIALAENYDVRIAAARILEARAQVTIARSFKFPELRPSRQGLVLAHRGPAPADAHPDSGAPHPGGRARLVLRDRPLGPLPARDGGSPRGAARQRGCPRLRDHDPRLRRWRGLLPASRAGPGARHLSPHSRRARGVASTHPAPRGRRGRGHDRREAGETLWRRRADDPDTQRQIEQTENVIASCSGAPAPVCAASPLGEQIGAAGCRRRCRALSGA
jgi:hypothetical protein